MECIASAPIEIRMLGEPREKKTVLLPWDECEEVGDRGLAPGGMVAEFTYLSIARRGKRCRSILIFIFIFDARDCHAIMLSADLLHRFFLQGPSLPTNVTSLMYPL